MVGPELSHRANTTAPGKGASCWLDPDFPGSRFRCAGAYMRSAPQHFSTEPHAMPGRPGSLCVCKATLQSRWLLRQLQGGIVGINSVFFPVLPVWQSPQGTCCVLYFLSHPGFSVINTPSFAPLLPRGLLSVTPKVTSITPHCLQPAL